MRKLLILIVILSLTACGATKETVGNPFDEAIAGLSEHSGFLDIYRDDAAGKILVRLPVPDDEGLSVQLIHAMRLKSGLGSNPIGLDRGWGNSGTILSFRQIGDDVIVEAENHKYVARTDAQAERDAVAQSFARSFIWQTDVIAKAPDGGLLIDLTGLLTTDFLGVADALKEDQGSFSLAKDRSMPDATSVLVFPDNVEADAFLTFTSGNPGAEVIATAPYPKAVTLTVHHSFVRLPDEGYQPRKADPRVGTFTLGFYDYAAPLEDQVLQAYAMRHRLEREDAGDPDSPVVEPIVFYVDPGAPDQIREALIDGASWWIEAFEAAGFPDGFRVKVLPEDAHPLDIRYNVIQWVHRQTRGWSYGGGIIDPRTGEFIKGHVILGSQRVRQDRMIFEGLIGTENTATGAADDPIELSLDRIRQLSAHEVSHAIGLGHNFAASSNDRASVTDYPAPWVVAREDGSLDFSRTYGEGIGAWDIAAVHWLYGQFEEPDEVEALENIIADARADGLLFVADQHGRSVGGAHPAASVWDNGSDPVAELRNTIAVRNIALASFGEDRIAKGRPASALADVLTPIYLYHRYQINAAAKLIGGKSFHYAVNGRDHADMEVVPAERQRAALEALLETLDPEFLMVPGHVQDLLVPENNAYWFRVPSEAFENRTWPIFDGSTAVETAADLTLSAVLHPARAERLVQFHLRDESLPSLDDVIATVESAVLSVVPEDPAQAHIARLVRGRYVYSLIKLESGEASQSVKAVARAALLRLEQRLLNVSGLPAEELNHRLWLADQLNQHLERPAAAIEVSRDGPKVPPGSPIGAMTSVYEQCWHCEGGL